MRATLKQLLTIHYVDTIQIIYGIHIINIDLRAKGSNKLVQHLSNNKYQVVSLVDNHLILTI